MRFDGCPDLNFRYVSRKFNEFSRNISKFRFGHPSKLIWDAPPLRYLSIGKIESSNPLPAISSFGCIFRRTRRRCKGRASTPRKSTRADSSIRIKETHMPSLSSQFGDTREISSEHCENQRKSSKIQISVKKTRIPALSAMKRVAHDVITQYTHIPRLPTQEYLKKIRRSLKITKQFWHSVFYFSNDLAVSGTSMAWRPI